MNKLIAPSDGYVIKALEVRLGLALAHRLLLFHHDPADIPFTAVEGLAFLIDDKAGSVKGDHI
ncbi:MAG: hypothetical protein U5L95_03295 [Candidatus Saccharibacteria bacterium]|nr:hypothetical protein [Candidatus Saccharibacteria bacterium]